jgi:hypothetical protein
LLAADNDRVMRCSPETGGFGSAVTLVDVTGRVNIIIQPGWVSGRESSMVVHGRKPYRTVEAAAAGFGLRSLEAAVQGKRHPWAYGLLGAIEYGSAQSPHRIHDRHAAFQSNQRAASRIVDLLDSVIPLIDRPAEAHQRPKFQPSAYSVPPAPV